MAEQLARLDPPGCGCLDCSTGYSKPLDLATDQEISLTRLGVYDDATGLDWRAIALREKAAARGVVRAAIAAHLEAGREC